MAGSLLRSRALTIGCISLLAVFVVVWLISYRSSKTGITNGSFFWKGPDTALLANDPDGGLIRYGRELVVHTSQYWGPRGTLAAITNGMNCQNCHLDAGTRPWGNNYGAVFSTYPRYRDRSGGIETIYKRVNDCIERSLNGTAIDSASREMQAIYAYIRWLGSQVEKGTSPPGTGIRSLPLLDRPADTVKGKAIYEAVCQRCHGEDGSGVLNHDGTEYAYPPLWGPNSFTTGAGLLRIGRLAGYVKDNMPFGIARYDSTFLTDEQAWDVAAYVTSRSRPVKEFEGDWPDISRKPFDFPSGPFADSFPVVQHRFGPFAPIRDYYENKRTGTKK